MAPVTLSGKFDEYSEFGEDGKFNDISLFEGQDSRAHIQAGSSEGTSDAANSTSRANWAKMAKMATFP